MGLVRELLTKQGVLHDAILYRVTLIANTKESSRHLVDIQKHFTMNLRVLRRKGQRLRKGCNHLPQVLIRSIRL